MRKKVFAKILEDDVEPIAYMEKEGLLMVSDSGAIEAAVDQVLAENPKTVEEFHSGKEKVLGFLVGQVMKKMRGKADPGLVNELLTEETFKSIDQESCLEKIFIRICNIFAAKNFFKHALI